jgi:hypothetical protein
MTLLLKSSRSTPRRGARGHEAIARAQENKERHTENCNVIPSSISKRAILKYMVISYLKSLCRCGRVSGVSECALYRAERTRKIQ